jgi:hypothetical protein
VKFRSQGKFCQVLLEGDARPVLHARDLKDLKRAIKTIADSEAVCCLTGPRLPYTEVFCATTTGTSQGRGQASSSLRIGLLSKVIRANLASLILDEVQTGRLVRQQIFVKESYVA